MCPIIYFFPLILNMLLKTYNHGGYRGFTQYLGIILSGVFNVNGGMKTSQYEEDESYSLTIHIKIF